MKLTVNKYLNARSGAPFVSSPSPFYLVPGTTIAIDEILIGEEIEGNSIWYHNKDDGCYYWSGGIQEVEFSEGQDLTNVNTELRNSILSQAKQYYLFKYQNIPGFTGISLADKVTAGQVTNGVNLSFQITHKQLNPDYLIPPVIRFKGFEISTDVVEAGYARLQWAYPGEDQPKRISGSISRLSSDEWGSCGIKVEGTTPDNAGTYVLTNFHVAAADLLKEEEYEYDYTPGTDRNECVMPAWTYSDNSENRIGHLYQGLFDAFHDIALICLNKPSAITNKTPDDILLKESLDIFNKDKYKTLFVHMYGSLSGRKKGTIVSVNSSQVFELNNKLYTKENLIQISRISERGDSGSVVILNELVIGILIGADSLFSYVIPIQRILNRFNLQLAQL